MSKRRFYCIYFIPQHKHQRYGHFVSQIVVCAYNED